MSIEIPRDQWKPTMSLRWAPKLQQMWWREVSEYSEYWKRVLWKPEYEWRDVPFEQPAQETRAHPEGSCLLGGDCDHVQDTRPECPSCFGDKTITMSDGSKRPCELCSPLVKVPPPETAACGCYSCSSFERRLSVMITCPDCGNKRCPKATHHIHTCTRSDAPGQPGSRYYEDVDSSPNR